LSKPKPWHALTVEEALKQLNVSETQGLTNQEAQSRLTTYGPNELKKEKTRSVFSIFLHQFKDVLMIIMLVATFLSLFMGELIDAAIILVFVFITALLGLRQEYRSGKAVEALKKMTAPTAIALRDGKEVKMPASQLVPGDILLLYTGDKVPADARIIEAHSLKLEEASLTGESAPVDKTSAPLPENTQLNDQRDFQWYRCSVRQSKSCSDYNRNEN
jgi:Ca2+-transporting ATPase